MEKELCIKFSDALVRFHKFTKLQSFQFSTSDAIPANVQNILLLVFFVHFFLSFMAEFYGEKAFYKVLW